MERLRHVDLSEILVSIIIESVERLYVTCVYVHMYTCMYYVHVHVHERVHALMHMPTRYGLPALHVCICDRLWERDHLAQILKGTSRLRTL